VCIEREGVVANFSARHPFLTRRSAATEPPTDSDTYLSVTEVAERIGLAVNTVKAYSQNTPRRMPNPDAMIGRVKGWSAATIDAWHARRAN
jgi:predicted DNA-binding transcriptional regulator AlpA